MRSNRAQTGYAGRRSCIAPRSTMQRDRAQVLDILAAARLLIAFTDGYDEATFQADLKTQLATLHQPMIIGERSSNYPTNSACSTQTSRGAISGACGTYSSIIT